MLQIFDKQIKQEIGKYIEWFEIGPTNITKVNQRGGTNNFFLLLRQAFCIGYISFDYRWAKLKKRLQSHFCENT